MKVKKQAVIVSFTITLISLIVCIFIYIREDNSYLYKLMIALIPGIFGSGFVTLILYYFEYKNSLKRIIEEYITEINKVLDIISNIEYMYADDELIEILSCYYKEIRKNKVLNTKNTKYKKKLIEYINKVHGNNITSDYYYKDTVDDLENIVNNTYKYCKELEKFNRRKFNIKYNNIDFINKNCRLCNNLKNIHYCVSEKLNLADDMVTRFIYNYEKFMLKGEDNKYATSNRLLSTYIKNMGSNLKLFEISYDEEFKIIFRKFVYDMDCKVVEITNKNYDRRNKLNTPDKTNCRYIVNKKYKKINIE